MTNQILLIEDSEVDYDIFLNAASGLTHKFLVNRTTTGEAALIVLNEMSLKRIQQPLFVVLDLNLPGMSGLDFVVSLRSDPRFKALPIIIISTSDNPKDLREAYEFGVNAYFVKPIRFEKFENLLRAIMEFWLLASVVNSDAAFTKLAHTDV